MENDRVIKNPHQRIGVENYEKSKSDEI